MFYTNARSLVKKRDELIAYAKSENPDIISITETWLNISDKHLISEVSIPGYNIFLNCRENKKGGGVCMYVRDTITATEINRSSSPSYEAVYVKLKVNKKHIIAATIYRPPKTTLENDIILYNELETIIKNKASIIFGDFNLPRINWKKLSSDNEGSRLLKLVNKLYLCQFVREPTLDNNVLDIVLTSDPDLINACEVGETLGNADHKIVRCEINCEVNIKENTLLVPNFNTGNILGLKSALQKVNWETVLANKDVEQMCESFTSILLETECKWIPQVRKRINNTKNPQWLTNDIKHILTRKKHLYNKYKKSKADSDYLLYVTTKRRCEREIRQSKRNLEINIAKQAKTNPKKFFQYIRSKKTVKEKIGPIKDTDDMLVSDNKIMATILNNFFHSVFITEDTSSLPTPVAMFTKSNNEKLRIDEISEDDINQHLRNLDPNKSTGADKISSRLLRECKEELRLPLKILFNRSLSEGIVPSHWKCANVTPIFKKGNKSEAGNYRPISLTSVVIKILEKIIRDKITAFLDKFRLILNTQHGFRNNRSCLTNLLEFFNYIFSNYDERIPSDIIYLDFRKAFDTVPHERLLIKLKAHGIGDKLCAWIKSWLTNRKQRVVINGEASDWLKVTSGVPQGSVLGPLLFLIYINDLDCGITSKISKFADDTKLGGKVVTRNDCEAIQRDLDNLSAWSRKWLLNFNGDKCKVMHVGQNNIKYSYKLQEKNLLKVTEEKDLGVIVRSDLKCSTQCCVASRKANTILGFIARNFDCKAPEVITRLYTSLVRPHLEYAVQFWSPHYLKDKNKLESVQRRATKLIPSIRNLSYEERLKRLNLFSLSDRRTRGDLIETFKILKKIDNIDYENLFEFSHTITRNNGLKLKGQRFNSDLRRNFFNFRVIDFWNKLPASVVQTNTVATFKKKLDEYYKENGF